QWLTLPGGTSGIPGGPLRISASSTSSAWMVNSNNVIFEFVSNGWIMRPGGAQDIAACTDGSAWAIGINPVPGGFGIMRWDGSTWNTMPGGAVRIAASSRDDAVVVNDQGHVFEFDPSNGNWTLLPGGGTAHDVAVGPDGLIGKSDPHGIISFFSRERHQWADIDSPPLRHRPLSKFRLIEVAIGPNGLPWIVDADGATYERT